MKKIMMLSCVIVLSLHSLTLDLKQGWNLIGNVYNDINITSTFPNATLAWKYDNHVWKGYSPNHSFDTSLQQTTLYDPHFNLLPGDGFWVYNTIDEMIIIDPNKAPIANAGIDQKIYYTENAYLNASTSSDDGNLLTYQWKENNIVLSNTIDVNLTGLSVGNHTITLLVTDDGGKQSTDTVIVSVFNSFTNTLPMSEVGSIKSSSSSCINSVCTTTLSSGSQLYFKITNNTNREYVITKMEIKSYYNGYATIRASSTNADLLGGSIFSPNESVSLGYGLSSSQTANYWTGTYYLTDIATGETFTNSFTWDKSSAF